MGLYFRLEVGHVNGKDNKEKEKTRTAKVVLNLCGFVVLPLAFPFGLT
jgi:hypothetical protein